MKYFKKSQIIYKYLIFLLLSLLTLLIITKTISQFFYYKKDINLASERLEKLKEKKEGSFYNNLKYSIFSYNDFNYLDDNLKIIFDRVVLDLEENNLITFSIDEEKNFEKKKSSNLKIGLKEGERKIFINCEEGKNIYYFVNSEKKFLDYRSSFYLTNGEEEKRVIDNYLNFRLKKIGNIILIDGEIAKPNEFVNFLKIDELNIRFFYNPNEISELEIENFINKIMKKEKEVNSIEIGKNEIKIDIGRNYIYCTKDLKINLSSLETYNFILLNNNFKYILKRDKVKRVFDLLSKEYENEIDKKLLENLIILGKNIYLPLKKEDLEEINYFSYLNNNELKKTAKLFLKEINNLKQKNKEEKIEIFLKLNDSIRLLKNNNYSIPYKKELENKEFKIEWLLYSDFLNEGVNFLKLNETFRTLPITIKKKKIVNSSEEEKVIYLLKQLKIKLKNNEKEVDFIIKGLKNYVDEEFIESNKKELGKNWLVSLLFVKEDEIKKYLLFEKDLKIIINNENVILNKDFFYLKKTIEKIVFEDNKVIIFIN